MHHHPETQGRFIEASRRPYLGVWLCFCKPDSPCWPNTTARTANEGPTQSSDVLKWYAPTLVPTIKPKTFSDCLTKPALHGMSCRFFARPDLLRWYPRYFRYFLKEIHNFLIYSNPSSALPHSKLLTVAFTIRSILPNHMCQGQWKKPQKEGSYVVCLHGSTQATFNCAVEK